MVKPDVWMEQLPGWAALLYDLVLTQSSSSPDGCQRHRAAGPLWAAALYNMAFSAENQNQTKPKGHSVNFLHLVCVLFFFFPSNIFAKAVQTDVHVGELMEDQQKAVSSTSYGRQGSLTYWLVLRLVYRLISSLPGMKASIASACYTTHARALSTAHYMYLRRLISCDLPLVI